MVSQGPAAMLRNAGEDGKDTSLLLEINLTLSSERAAVLSLGRACIAELDSMSISMVGPLAIRRSVR